MTASKKSIGSNLAKVDAYENTAADYEELPEITDEQFALAVPHHNGKPVRGRPPLKDKAKKLISLRLDRDVIDAFKASGSGWQGRMNDFLAARATVVDLILEHEASAVEMRKVVTMMRDGDLSPLAPKLAKSVDSAERQIAITENAARAVRKVLNDHAIEHTTRF